MEVHKNGIIYFVTATEAIVGGLEKYLPIVDIVEKINGRPVTRIANYAFLGSNIMEINLPSTLTRIGDGAFQGCPQLMKVIVKKGKNTIPLTVDELAFADCENLFEVWAEERIVKLKERCFSGCKNLHRLEFNICWMMKEVFYGCNRLHYVTFDDNPLFMEKSFVGANNIKAMLFIGNAQVDEIESYILYNNIKIQCLSTSNLVELVFDGFTVEVY